MSKKKRVLVCGATGFIGRNIADVLSRNEAYEVVGTYFKSDPSVIAGVRMVSVDLTDRNAVDRLVRGMDIIIQAAATTSGAKDIMHKPYYHVTDNALMNSLIFRAAFEHHVSHVVFFSCTVMYPSSDVPLKETDFDANKEIYSSYFGVGWTKVYIEKMCEFYSRIGDTKYTVLRHSNIYGPFDKFDLERSHVFGATMTKVMRAPQEGSIQVWGSGEEGRDLLYIDDLTDFVLLAIGKQKTKFELCNVGFGEVVSIKDLIKRIIACSGKKLTMKHDLSKPTLKTSLCLDTVKAKEVFGWLPRVSLEEGIKKTMAWYGVNIPFNSEEKYSLSKKGEK